MNAVMIDDDLYLISGRNGEAVRVETSISVSMQIVLIRLEAR